ncbi:CaiB/BaiF CoA transferase family protein [Rhodothermus profundi]|uniref:Crotonobetainyl-CoA:carnitine CoA-transferase CaiB n=1 Tax=Rhodothermus profundi TaxID=633813 RepID=A0A1M6QA80_9BACT|nr:CaiB/BaiF CoA-transferase family protein [Rhodothermus profundi]SHK17152.1 Crotonobetainyl-CoA:carnitine CoA-transferase CaiB [Rhodothermus profundi]
MPGPLASLRVLDFTTLLPGPYATLLLADLGADVVRIEAPDRPDLMRLAPPYDETGVAAGYAWIHRSKRSVALDLKHPKAAMVVRRLVRHYDVVIEGFRPGVMQRLGLDYETLAKENPALIYCSITGYGQTGPYRERAGHDLNYQALSGLLSHTGRREAGPGPSGVPLADVAGGLFAALAILAAVVHRQRTGKGQYLDLALLDTTIAFNGLAVSGFLAAGHQPGYETEPLNGGSFYDCYRTRDGRYLAVAGLEPKFWEGFCKAIGRPDLAPYGYNVWDVAVQQRLKKEIHQTIASRTLAEWQARFAEHDVCVEPVLTLEEMTQHPQVQARQLIVTVSRPDGTTQRQVGFPVHFSRTPPTYRHTGPSLGAHTLTVLQEAGFTMKEIQKLAAEGAFGAGLATT